MDTSFAALWRAYRECRRTKRNTRNALAFEIDAEAKLLELQGELRERTYRPGRSICFVTDGPKPREVFAADFRDRVVHHLLVAYQARRLEPRFIHDSYACRPGRGVLAASDRLMTFLRRATGNGRRAAWALKLDVASFFPSIDKAILLDLLCRDEPDVEARWLTEVLLFHDPTQDYRYRPGRRGVPPPGSPDYPVPARKSLFHTANRRGLPIGNLTSQFWANVYLNEVDQHAKRRLGCAMYLRYVDDIQLIAGDPETLHGWRMAIAGFLAERLHLELRREKAEPRPRVLRPLPGELRAATAAGRAGARPAAAPTGASGVRVRRRVPDRGGGRGGAAGNTAGLAGRDRAPVHGDTAATGRRDRSGRARRLTAIGALGYVA